MLARYPIIMRDETYSRLLTIAASRNLTMGKFLNLILENFSEESMPKKEEAKKIENPCAICGHPSVMTLKHVKGYLKLFCQACGENAYETHKWFIVPKGET